MLQAHDRNIALNKEGAGQFFPSKTLHGQQEQKRDERAKQRHLGRGQGDVADEQGQGVTCELNEDSIPVLIAGVEGDMKFNSMQNLDYTLRVNGQWLDTEEKTMKGQTLSYQG